MAGKQLKKVYLPAEFLRVLPVSLRGGYLTYAVVRA
jgi:hypothetical protein